MAKPELGTKRLCAGCGAKFYDLGKTPPVCPTCGSTVFYTMEAEPDMIAVAIGAFADPDFPAPTRSVYEGRRHRWTGISGDHVERWD